LTTKLAIYGAGGFGRETAVMIRQINSLSPTWDVIGFFDDGLQKGDGVDGLPVLGNIADLNCYREELSLCIAVADPFLRYNLTKKITNAIVNYPVIVHPASIIGDPARNKLGRGSIITAGVILTTGIELGEFCLINLSSTVGHDVKLGNCCTVMPACSISGNVSIGSCCVLGTGSRIIQGINIGENCVVGAGSVVTKSFGSNLKILGVPARRRVHRLPGA